ncbi:MAG: hypothetical protein ACI9N1_000854 [Flavobacteriales bacterium]|jgi:hypothetical protein
MKCIYLFVFVMLSFFGLAQTALSEKYNLDFVDSCLAEIDTSIKVIELRFVNGNDADFEKFIMDAVMKLDHVKFFYCKSERCSLGEDSFKDKKGVSIEIYYESLSCTFSTSNISINPSDGFINRLATTEDKYICWSFKKDSTIVRCK